VGKYQECVGKFVYFCMLTSKMEKKHVEKCVKKIPKRKNKMIKNFFEKSIDK